jgi:Tol biopolymer transport system component
MSPEQLEGKEVDTRTDIFAFGSVLYEMATGQKAFTGKSQVSLMSAILKDEPPQISQMQPLAPAALDRVVKTCLAKDPDERWQNAHDLMKELMWVAEGSSQFAAATASPSRPRYLLWILAGLFLWAIVASWVAYSNYKSTSQKLLKLSIAPPIDNELVGAPVISPDGSRIVFPAADKNGKINLWLRTIDNSEAKKISGTEGANDPFWSPDGRFIGFFANRKLLKVDPFGGLTQVLSEASDERGGTWNKNGVIVFSPNPGDGLYRINSSGGEITLVTSLNSSKAETTHRFPYFLPDGKHFIFFVKAHKAESGIYLGSLDSQENKFLLRSDRSAIFSSGYLLFQRSNTLLVQAFDTKKLQLSGEPIPLSENVWYEPVTWGTRGMDISNDKILTYIEGSNRTQLLWFDRNGHQEGPMASAEQFASSPTFSPDGKKFAMQIMDGQYSQIWLYDSLSGNRSRFTFSSSNNGYPVWSPDGSRIVFGSNRDGPYQLYQKDTKGFGNDERLNHSKNWQIPLDWSPDNRFILYEEQNPKSNYDIWVLQLGDQKKLFPFLATDANEANARFSPNGKWVAYCSDESGQPEIYVQSFLAEKGGKWQISTNGGFTPRWNRDGKELYYLSADNQIMASEVKVDPSFEASVPKPLVAIHPFMLPRITGGWSDAFESAPDGRRFAVHAALTNSRPNITVVLNWPLLLNQKPR